MDKDTKLYMYKPINFASHGLNHTVLSSKVEYEEKTGSRCVAANASASDSSLGAFI